MAKHVFGNRNLWADMALVVSLSTWLFSASGMAADQPSNAASDETDKLRKVVVRLAVDQVDSALAAVANSTQAIASEWVQAHQSTIPVTEEQHLRWNGRYLAHGKTIQFQTWNGALSSAPAYQSSDPSWYGYRGLPLNAETFRQLEVFEKLTPAVRAAYRSFPYAWSYITTADDMMLLYPFLTLEEAVNNLVPTGQVFYQQAGFAQRAPGWTPPYLDLAGAGLMVTVSTPAYDGDTLLGVVSHDITLRELSESILTRISKDAGGAAWLVDKDGLVIAVSDAALEQELQAVNTKAQAAVLHYRLADPSTGSGDHQTVVSSTAWINALTGAFLRAANENPKARVLTLGEGRQALLAGRSALTGWLLVWHPHYQPDNP